MREFLSAAGINAVRREPPKTHFPLKLYTHTSLVVYFCSRVHVRRCVRVHIISLALRSFEMLPLNIHIAFSQKTARAWKVEFCAMEFSCSIHLTAALQKRFIYTRVNFVLYALAQSTLEFIANK